MPKVAINNCFGGFSLSQEAYEKLIEWGVRVCKFGDPVEDNEFVIYDDWKGEFYSPLDDRTHPLLVRVIEELGKRANGSYAQLRIADVPDGVDWSISEYDGVEHIAENHRTW